MPDVSSYITINDKKFGESMVKVIDPKSDSICRKGVFRYGMILLAWLAVGIFLLYMRLAVKRSNNHECFNDEWQVYKSIHGKDYSQEEDEMRMRIFLSNKKEIENHNKFYLLGIESYRKEINMFSDFTPKELDGMRGFRGHMDPIPPADAFSFRENATYPTGYDWRLKGAITEVKNQGSYCGSCYAFSATGSLEAQRFLKTGRLVSLSEQNLVDCSKAQGNHGCNGGNMINSFYYIMLNNGIDTQQSYPYEGKEGPCRFQRGAVGATVRGYRSVAPSERALQAAVVDVGPISVGMDATDNFAFYQTGIFDDSSCNPSNINHAVLVVGYGSAGGRDYWIVKNSWGKTWGEGGYMRIARNRGDKCGIVSMASYPLV